MGHDKETAIMKQRLLAKLKEHGYGSQRSVVRALQEKGYYADKRSNSLTTFLNQIINGRRPAPSHLREGLTALCNSDPEITSLLARPSGGLEVSLESAFDELYDLLKAQFRGAERSTKMRMYLAFEYYVQNGLRNNPEEK